MKIRDSYGHILKTEVDASRIHLTGTKYSLINTYGLGLSTVRGYESTEQILAFLSERGIPKSEHLREPIKNLQVGKNLIVKHPYKWDRYTITRNK